MNTKMIKIEELVSEGLQVRCALNEEVIQEYAEKMRAGAEFPPIVVFRDSDGELFLADGFHRVEAARQNGSDTLAAEVRDGGYDAAMSFALSANDKHGLRRTNADKRRALEMAWENRDLLFTEFKGQDENGQPNGLPSSRQLSEITGISFKSCASFIKNTGVCNLHTPLTDEELEEAALSAATTVTKEHLEERNPSVRENLKNGLDRYGMAIPEHLRAAFAAREPQAIVRQLGKIHKFYKALYLAGNTAFAAVGQDGLIRLDNAIRCFRLGFPHCVCRACRGLDKRCASCSGRGFQTKLQYQRMPREYRV